MNNSIQITDLNLTSIEASLKEWLKDTPEFAGYNFEGTVMNRIIKILAYNTYQQAYLSNMIANESYLDSAQLRENVVSRAKALCYTPRSMSAAHATITLIFTPSDDPASIFIPKYTAFRSTSDGINFNFITLEDNYVQESNGTYIKSIDVYEGQSYTYSINYNIDSGFYEIPDPKVDISKIKVYVKENSLTTDRVEYHLVDTITDINSESLVYFIQENANGKYEIYFGDGVLGKALETGNVVLIEALVTNGELGNRLGTFLPVGATGYNSANYAVTYQASVSTSEISSDGQDRESVESIRFNAPKKYAEQDRTVIDQDYKNYLTRKYSDLESISVWGGQNNDPPIYGKTILSVKPKDGYVISNFRKDQIIKDLKTQNVMAIDPMIIDPLFTYINIRTTVSYNSKTTTKKAEEIYGSAAQAIMDYEKNSLSQFEKTFKFSKLDKAIDDSDPAISSNDLSFQLEKRIAPIYFTTLTYKLLFSAPIYNPYAGHLGSITSTPFKLANTGANVCYLDDDGLGNIRIYTLNGITKVYLNNTAGKVDYQIGSITLDSFNFTELYSGDTEFRVSVVPEGKTYTPIRNEILLLSHPKIQVYDENFDNIVYADTVDVLGNTSPISSTPLVNTVIF